MPSPMPSPMPSQPETPAGTGDARTGAEGGPSTRRRLRRAALLALSVLTSTALAGGAVNVLRPAQAEASSHREAPLISGQPQYDNTDLYAFVSPDKPDTTTLIANFVPFEEPSGGPNFYPFANDARYDINIDNDGDAQPDLIYRWTFRSKNRNPNSFLYNTGVVTSVNDPDLNFIQTYDLQLIHLTRGYPVRSEYLARNAPVAPSDVGKASMPSYAALRYQAITKLRDGSQGFAGQADDPFFADLRVFDLLYGGDLSESGNDTLRGYNVNSLALQVPSRLLRYDSKHPILGIWSSVSRQSAYSNDWVQVSRLGNPLVNEVVIPVGQKDRFNASQPKDDAQFLRAVTYPELPKLLESIFKIPAPKEPRNDLVQVFLTGVPGLNQPPYVKASEELRLNTSIYPTKYPKRLGVLDGDKAGFPNGRRLTDDVIDISLQVVAGALLGEKNDLSDKVDANDVGFEKSFPYVALPHRGSDVHFGSSSAGYNQSGTAKLSSGLVATPGGSNSTTTTVAIAGGAAAAGVLGGLLVTRRNKRRRRSAHGNW